jgi:hypothetical protein
MLLGLSSSVRMHQRALPQSLFSGDQGAAELGRFFRWWASSFCLSF